MFFLPPPPPVSYAREVAAVFALHCNSCHGDSGGLSTRGYADIMKGGNLGQAIVPGKPDRSLLLDFIEGRRGEPHRMPLGGRPLTRHQVATIRRWIAEGANNDGSRVPVFSLMQTVNRAVPGTVLRISCKSPVDAYMIIGIRDANAGTSLWSEVATVKSPKDRGDSGERGKTLSWDVKVEQNWPASLRVELQVPYSRDELTGAELRVTRPAP